MRLKKASLNGCTGQDYPPGNQGSILTVSVVAELELNGASPPPDMVEEKKAN